MVPQRINVINNNGGMLEAGKTFKYLMMDPLLCSLKKSQHCSSFIGAVALKEDSWALIGDSLIEIGDSG